MPESNSPLPAAAAITVVSSLVAMQMSSMAATAAAVLVPARKKATTHYRRPYSIKQLQWLFVDLTKRVHQDHQHYSQPLNDQHQ